MGNASEAILEVLEAANAKCCKFPKCGKWRMPSDINMEVNQAEKAMCCKLGSARNEEWRLLQAWKSWNVGLH